MRHRRWIGEEMNRALERRTVWFWREGNEKARVWGGAGEEEGDRGVVTENHCFETKPATAIRTPSLFLSLSQRSGPARGRPCVCWLGYASPFWTLLDRPIIFIIYYSCYHHLHGINGANNWLIIWAMA